MTPKWKLLERITDGGLVGIVRTESPDKALRLAAACIDGGVTAIEITFTVPGALQVIAELAKTYRDGQIIVGAGTVLDAETARAAILAGAAYVVTPALNVDTVRLCNRYQIPVMSGAMTVKETIEALEAGSDIVKVFPGGTLGPSFIKAIRGPLPQAPLMPTGGVSLDNVGDWIKAGCVAVGVGGKLTSPADKGDYAAVTATAQQFIAKIKAARG